MTEQKIISVFDTNVYIGLGFDELRKTIELEAEAGVFALTSVWPCLELLRRVISNDNRRVQRALSTLKRIVLHTGYETDEGSRLRVHEAGEFTLARGLFGHEPQDPLLEIGFVADLVIAAAELDSETFRSTRSAELSRVRERVEFEEKRMAGLPVVAAEHAGLERARLPTKLDLKLVAAGLVQVLAEEYGFELGAINSGAAVDSVAHNFGIALAFVYGLINDVDPLSGVPGGSNSVWDMKIAFHAGRGGKLSGIPVLLVTDDGRLLRAASEAGEPHRIVAKGDYLALLSDEVALRTRIDLLLD